MWALTEKDTSRNLSCLTNIALDPAFGHIVTWFDYLPNGFIGGVGALRKDTCLLASCAIFHGILLVLEMTAGILGLIFKDWIKSQVTNSFLAIIVHYRDDPDEQNLYN